MDPAYLSVITLHEADSRDDLIAVLADAGVADGPTLRLRLALLMPHILGRFPPERAEAGLRLIRQRGGDAFACTMQDIESLGPTFKVRDMAINEGFFHVELWRGEPVQLPFDEVHCLIRASLRETKSKVNFDTGGGIRTGMFMVAPEIAVADAIVNPGQPTKSRNTRVSQKLDIHSSDRVFQIDGDKFGYEALGGMRGHSDKSNMDQMLDLLRYVAPNAIVDDFYPLFRTPPRFERLRLPMMTINNEDPAFAFYSRWAALMYRHLTASG